jgi:hypothetical protein
MKRTREREETERLDNPIVRTHNRWIQTNKYQNEQSHYHHLLQVTTEQLTSKKPETLKENAWRL